MRKLSIAIVTFSMVLAVSCAVFLFESIASSVNAEEISDDYYPDCGLVTEVIGGETDTYRIYILMQNGNTFAFESEDGDWFEGDLAAVIMDSNGTPTVENDRIIDAKYVGWVSDEEISQWVKDGD